MVTYALSLYDDLRAADLNDIHVVVAVLPPAEGLGIAIRDRLVKAAASN
jgi:L-threonylcarbamoyladenylate synthase